VTRAQYAIIASLLPRLSDEDLASLLMASERMEAQRHTPLGAIVAVLPKLSDVDLVHLLELVQLVTDQRRACQEAVPTVAGGPHVA
jgi:hypothetical protein